MDKVVKKSIPDQQLAGTEASKGTRAEREQRALETMEQLRVDAPEIYIEMVCFLADLVAAVEARATK